MVDSMVHLLVDLEDRALRLSSMSECRVIL